MSSEPKTCKVRGCNKESKHRTLRLCPAHFKVYRKRQMAPVIAKWQKRIKAGTVTPKFVYRRRPSASALAHPGAARAFFKKRGRERMIRILDAALARAEKAKAAEKKAA